jgi:hypothetical protein
MKLRASVMVVLLLGFGLRSEELAVPEAVIVAVATPVANLAGEAAKVKDGYALLNSLLTLFENVPVVKAKKGSEREPKVASVFAEVDNRLVQLSKDAKTALEAGLIDKIFHRHYQRLLTIFKAVITPVIGGELLKDLFMRAFDDFVWDVTCEHWSWGDEDGVAKMAAAMEEEFVQMQFYLDSRKARAEFKKKIGNRLLPPSPAKGKSDNQ